jgi:phospholipase/carboxylesterase/glyoxalase family protein
VSELGYVHRFLPAAGDPGKAPVLLILHGTGGDENDLIPLGQKLLPGAAILSPRGNVLERGMPRFFRRIAEGVFDLEDLERRTGELRKFLDEARERYRLARNPMIAVGYSNGANIAASLILREPRHLAGGVLLRAMVPFTPEEPPDLSALSIFLSAGRRDPIVPAENTQRLAGMFESGGARVTLHWHDGGHELGQDDIESARAWLEGLPMRPTHSGPTT